MRTRLAALRQADVAAQYDRVYQRSRVTRAQIAEAIQRYYSDPEDFGYITARVGDDDLPLSLLARPEWPDLGIRLGTEAEHFRYRPTVAEPSTQLSGPPLNAALDRLADVAFSETRLFGNPLYRLLDLTMAQGVQATMTTAGSVHYALTLDLLESELIDAVALGTPMSESRLPLRGHYLPTTEAAAQWDQRLCVGGPLALVAAARPGSRQAPDEPDFVLLIQERSARVMNMAGRLAVIPKSFHEPIASERDEVAISASLERELEEELLGRVELELPSGKVDPLHVTELSEPMRWLVERRGTDAYRVECTGFGVNMVSGNYEFACLIVIDDEEWWTTYGGQVDANWEAGRVRQYSSRDTDGLTALLTDPAWSNEGLFACVLGLRRLASLGVGSRVAPPNIELEV